jgi:hypothetical protein
METGQPRGHLTAARLAVYWVPPVLFVPWPRVAHHLHGSPVTRQWGGDRRIIGDPAMMSNGASLLNLSCDGGRRSERFSQHDLGHHVWPVVMEHAGCPHLEHCGRRHGGHDSRQRSFVPAIRTRTMTHDCTNSVTRTRETDKDMNNVFTHTLDKSVEG